MTSNDIKWFDFLISYIFYGTSKAISSFTTANVDYPSAPGDRSLHWLVYKTKIFRITIFYDLQNEKNKIDQFHVIHFPPQKYNKNPHLKKTRFCHLLLGKLKKRHHLFVVTEKSQRRSGHVFWNSIKLKIFENKNKKTIQTDPTYFE